MKKIIFSAFTFLMFSTAVVFAQDAGETSPATQDQEPALDATQEMRTEVSPQELPDAISTTLQDEYAEWTPIASYMVTSEEEGQHYAVDIQKEEEIKTVKFDSEGNEMDKNRDEGLE